MKTLVTLFISLTVSLIFHACADPQKANLDKRLKTYKYPFKTKLFKFLSQTQKLEMAYMHETPGPEKKVRGTALLLHGKNFSGAYWEKTAQELLKYDFNVLIPDQIGFGRSSKPLNYQYSLHQLAHNTKKLMDWHKLDKVTLVGHSMGGMLAIRFALMFPEKVQKLILVNPIGLEDYQQFVPYYTIDALFEQQLKLTPQDVKNYQQTYYYDGQWRPEYDRWLKLQTGLIKGPDWQFMAYINALTFDMIYTSPVVHQLDQLKVKTHLIIGDRDTTALGKNHAAKSAQAKLGLYEHLAKKAHAQIEDSHLTFLKGLGHMPHIEDFERFWEAFQKTLAD